MKKVNYIENITKKYLSLGYEPYEWFEPRGKTPFVPLEKPLSESVIGLLTTSGAYFVGQKAFHYKDDTSVRLIPKEINRSQLRFSHITENYLENPRKDSRCIFPLHQLLLLEKKKVIKEVAANSLSCMGGIYSKRRVQEELAPSIYKNFKDQKIDIALLVPM